MGMRGCEGYGYIYELVMDTGCEDMSGEAINTGYEGYEGLRGMWGIRSMRGMRGMRGKDRYPLARTTSSSPRRADHFEREKP